MDQSRWRFSGPQAARIEQHQNKNGEKRKKSARTGESYGHGSFSGAVGSERKDQSGTGTLN
jgi:TctA family transporter